MEHVKQERPLTELVSDLSEKSGLLLKQEIQLAKTEVDEKIDRIKADVAAIAVGAAVAYLGAAALVAAMIIGLSHVMPAWLSALLVGAAISITGYVMVNRGNRGVQEESAALEKTTSSIKKDIRMVKESIQ